MHHSVNEFPLSLDVKELIQRKLWTRCRPAVKPKHTHLLDDSYFQYYTTRCQRFLRDGRIHVLLKEHSEIFDIARTILCHNSTWDDVRTYISANYPPSANHSSPDEAISTTINLCGSLLLMAEIGTHKYGVSGWNPLPWGRQQTLRQAVQCHFQPQKSLLPDHQRLGSIFTARNLVNISGIKIKWTENIVDHLLLADDDQAVFVFPYVGFLRHHQSFLDPIYPTDFVEETLRTLSLLFPANDRKSRRWLKGILKSNNDEQQCLGKGLSTCGSLRSHERRFENFSYWHDRLVILKQAFDDSSPRTLNQWWNDRRNSVQWYTFWVAIMVFIMTVVFGVVQSVEGAMQTYFSWRALQQV